MDNAALNTCAWLCVGMAPSLGCHDRVGSQGLAGNCTIPLPIGYYEDPRRYGQLREGHRMVTMQSLLVVKRGEGRERAREL